MDKDNIVFDPMAMQHCKVCKKPIANNARACPHCGAKNKGGFLKFILVIVFLLIVLSAALGQNSNDSEQEAYYNQGYNDGYDAGYQKGLKKGKKKALASVKQSSTSGSTAADGSLPESGSSESEAYQKGTELADKVNDFLSGKADSESELSESDYKSLCQTLDFNSVMRNPDEYKGEYVIVSGNVDQIIEGWFDTYTIFINDRNGNKWGCTYSYKNGEPHLIEGDYITAYGECSGTATNETVLGKQVTMPRVDLEYIN